MESQYARLRDRFQDLGWISEGYMQNRGPGAGGPCYQWTRKVRGKPSVWPCHGNSMNGCVKRSATGGKCNKTSKKCSTCRAKFSLPLCPIPSS